MYELMQVIQLTHLIKVQLVLATTVCSLSLETLKLEKYIVLLKRGWMRSFNAFSFETPR